MSVEKEESDKVFQVLKAQKANKMCFDCQASSPAWTSVWYGVYICYNCSSAHRNLGVHISFVRSTSLDNWRTDHLRRMKCGGNASATEFFSRHGGTAFLTELDVKKKYTSNAAELYRKELDKRVEADAAQYPAGIFVEGATSLAPASAPAESADDDFFDTWDKPTTSSKSPTVSTIAPKPPSISRAASTPPAPRTVTSASLRSNTTASAKPARLGAARLNSASSGAARGLKATKAATPLDFEKAQREAEAEAARVRQLGYDRKREEEEAAAARTRALEEQAVRAKAQAVELGGPAKSGIVRPASASAGGSRLVGHQKGNSQDMARLGMGMKRLGLGSAAGGSPAAASTPTLGNGADEPTYARDNFAAQKGISSDMYFGRGMHDPTRSAGDQARLQQFAGATSISSAAYFGREEEEGLGGGGGGSADGVLGDGSLEGMQSAARDAIARVMANPDVQNGVENLRAGALKLSEYLAQMGER
ncbi:ArfGap-domain-containing protein [Phellopilus nigrolimitatus]|nr:ArfGap-domain-containing protein [Phellopilus nigrolimitatus]